MLCAVLSIVLCSILFIASCESLVLDPNKHLMNCLFLSTVFGKIDIIVTFYLFNRFIINQRLVDFNREVYYLVSRFGDMTV